MDDLDDVIGLLNSNRQQKVKASTISEQVQVDEEKEISNRKLNIEKMMEELEAMKTRK